MCRRILIAPPHKLDTTLRLLMQPVQRLELSQAKTLQLCEKFSPAVVGMLVLQEPSVFLREPHGQATYRKLQVNLNRFVQMWGLGFPLLIGMDLYRPLDTVFDSALSRYQSFNGRREALALPIKSLQLGENIESSLRRARIFSLSDFALMNHQAIRPLFSKRVRLLVSERLEVLGLSFGCLLDHRYITA